MQASRLVSKKSNKKEKDKRDNFDYNKKIKIIKKYISNLNLKQQQKFYNEGCLPCQYCKQKTYIGPTKIYMKHFSFNNIKKIFAENTKLNIDHFIPCFQGGNANIDNGVVSCTYCNKKWLYEKNKNLDNIKMFFLKQYSTHGPMIDDDTEDMIRDFLDKKPYSRT